jgi:UDP-N-acetylglucosamine 2-epimerase (non-hydrolysing)
MPSPKTRILSVVGARPNFMKVAPIHRAFQTPHYALLIEHQIVHTGQHYDAAMSDAFFNDLEMPAPAYFLGVGSGSHAEQTAKVMVGFEKVCLEAKPALVLVVGDVNSTIAATLTAKKLDIPVAHVEAGLRSFDRTMPEELNRIATDALCDYAFVTEQSGVDNLLRENFQKAHCYLVGNTMIDSLYFALPKARESAILQTVGVNAQKYVLATLHRPSNVDEPAQLRALVDILTETAREYAVVFPIHPRTRKNIQEFGLSDVLAASPNIHLIEPQGYINFLALMMNAKLVMTDSGGVQEETTALGVPCLTLRTTTERPITCELGTNILVQPETEAIRTALHNALHTSPKLASVPPLWDGKAAERICEILLRTVH